MGIEQEGEGIGVLAALEGDGIERREARVRAPELGLGPKGCGEAGRLGLSLSSLDRCKEKMSIRCLSNMLTVSRRLEHQHSFMVPEEKKNRLHRLHACVR